MKARLASTVTALALLVAVAAGAVPAQADPVPEAQRLQTLTVIEAYQLGSKPTGVDVHLSTVNESPLPAGMAYNLTMFSCGRLVGSETRPHTFENATAAILEIELPSPYGIAETVGPDLELRVEVSQPGFDPYVLTETHNLAARGIKTPSCANVAPAWPNFDDPIEVTTWSTAKVKRAKVGKKATLTPTLIAPDGGWSQVTYEWHLGKPTRKQFTTPTVGYGRSIRVKPKWKGKPLFAQVHVEDADVFTESDPDEDGDFLKVVRFGRVRG